MGILYISLIHVKSSVKNPWYIKFQELIMNLKFLKDQDLEASFQRVVATERKVLHVVIMHVQEVARRRLYLSKGYPSLFSYLTSEMKYSNAAAQRRIEAARLASAVPSVAAKIEAGNINLSHLAEVQSAVKSAESIHQVKVSSEMKAELIERVQNQSIANTQQLCAQMLDIPVTQHQSIKSQKDNSKRIETTLSQGQYEKFERVRDLLAHKNFQKKRTQDIADVLETMFDELLTILDPAKMKSKKAADQNQEVSHGKAITSASEVKSVAASITSASEVKSVAASITSASEVKSFAASSTPASEIRSIDTCGTSASELYPDLESFFKAEGRRNPSDLSRDIPEEDVPLLKWHSLTPKRRKIILKAHACCQYLDHKTGRTCGSTFNLHVDHIQPKWAGGVNDPHNLRVLCREHNLYRSHH
jgi:hypothetical protein